jgi:hypothetical protein
MVYAGYSGSEKGQPDGWPVSLIPGPYFSGQNHTSLLVQ